MLETTIFNYTTIPPLSISCKDTYWELPSKDEINVTNAALPLPLLTLRNQQNEYVLVGDIQHWEAQKDKPLISVAILKEDLPRHEVWLYRLAQRQNENNLNVFAFAVGLHKYLEAGGALTNPILQQIAINASIPIQKITPTFLSFVINPLEELKQACVWNQLGFKEFSLLASCSQEDLLIFSKLTTGLQLKGNKLLQLLQAMIDLQKGYNISFQELETQLAFITKQEQLAPSVKYKTLRNAIVKKRYPCLEKHLQTLEKLKQALHLPPQLQCNWDSTLEEEGLHFSFTITKDSQLQDHSQTLASIAKKQEIQQMLSLLK